MKGFTLRQIEENDIEAVQDFLFSQLGELFNQEAGQGAVTKDVWNLKKTYLEPADHAMWAAFDHRNNVVGTIAICRYNDRIEIVKGRYDLQHTAEIGRCYLRKDLRRQGIGGALFSLAEDFCRGQGYRIIYLHTHHFLPGGYNFWQKNGFCVTVDEGGILEIVHMEKPLKI
jgi:GNAT superfamily N-acetyltransferase